MKHNIPQDEISCNSESEIGDVFLDEEDETSEYTIVPNSLIRNKGLSPECRWLIIYLISNTKGWRIKSKQIWEHTKGFIGRDKVLKRINEAIDAGYICRIPVSRNVNGKFLKGFVYKVASTPKFKKCFRHPGFQGPDLQEPDLQGAEAKGRKEVLSKEVLSKERYTSLKVPDEGAAEAALPAKAGEMESLSPHKKNPKTEFTEKVKDVGKRLLQILEENEPDYSPPKNPAAFLTEVDFMLRLDKRDPQKVEDVLRWALADSFWRDKMFKPNPAKYLREKFLQLKNKMEAKPPMNPNKVDRRYRDENGNTVDDWKDRLF